MKMKLDMVEHAAQEMQNLMEQVSNGVRKAEEVLKATKLHIAYDGPIIEGDDGVLYRLSWKKNGEHFRLMYNNERPLIETKFEIRLKCLPQLPAFLEEYSQFINDKRAKLKQALELLEDLELDN